jgi:hypothetical protein
MKTGTIQNVLGVALLALVTAACDADQKQGEVTATVSSALTCCSGNGYCDYNGNCLCDEGFVGSECQYSRNFTCSGHGTPDEASGLCACDVGFVGARCQSCASNYYRYPTCRYCLASTTCSGHGSCNDLGTCSCDVGFAGPSCDTCATNYTGPNCVPSSSDFSIGLGAVALAIPYGGSYTLSVFTAVTSGSAQSIALSLSGVPSGATATLTPASVTSGASSTLFVAAGTAAAGTYTLTLTGTAASGTHSASLSLSIAPPTACDNDLDACRANLASCQEGGSDASAALASANASLAAANSGLATCQAQSAATAQQLASCQASGQQLQASLDQCSGALATCSGSRASCATNLAACQSAQGDTDGDGIPDRLDRCAATKSGDAVDPAGCSLAQFCAAVDAGGLVGVATCVAVDWQNDEPIGPAFDCRVVVDHGRKTCVPLR